LSIKWLIRYSREEMAVAWRKNWPARSSQPARVKVVLFKKKEDTHRMAEANKAFAHFKV